MSTPILIDGTQPAGVYQDNDFGEGEHLYRNYGPVVYGGALWSFMLTGTGNYPNPFQPDPDATQYVTVYKSTDGGNTWVQQDISHAPQWNVSEAIPFVSNYYWDGTSSIVTIVWILGSLDSGDHSAYVNLVDFNMSTGLYGTPYGNDNIGPNLPETLIAQPCLSKLSGGTLRLIYQFGQLIIDGMLVNGKQIVYYRDYSSGSWGSDTALPNQTVANGTNGQFWGVTFDGDLSHVIYSVGTFTEGTPNPIPNADKIFYYVMILADGTFSSTTDLTSLLSNPGTFSTTLTNGIVSGTNIFFPLTKYISSTTENGVLSATGSGGVLTSFIYTTIGASNYPSDWRMLHLSDQDIYVCGGDINVPTNNSSLFWISSNTGSGWSTPTLFLNLDTNPTAPVSGFDTLDDISISLGVNLDGSPGLMFTTWAAYYTPVSVTFSLGCGDPPTGYIGLFYSNALVVSGGAPPYTFSIISGSLPPGLALNPLTGVISGTPFPIRTPSSKTFSFTVKVTDSNGLTATVSCSITIKNFLAGLPCNSET